MTRKILTLLIMTLLFITVFVSCSDKKEEIDVTNIDLDITQTALAPGESLTLVATVTPVGSNAVSWHSSDNSVATVKDGIITAVSNGNAVIICASDNGIFAMCRVVVDSGLCKHTEIEWVVLTEPTCTTEGLKYSYCKNEACGMRLEDKVIEKAPHTPGEITKHNAVVPTCSAEGSYEEIAYCVVCGELALKETKTVAKLPHTFGEWSTVTEPSCYASGIKVQSCLKCNHKNEQEIPMREHFTTTVPGREPTCTSEGWEAYEKCMWPDCDYNTKQLITGGEHVYTISFIMGNPTETSSAKGMLTCSEKGCNYATNIETYPALSSDRYTVEVLENGKNKFTISVLNDENELVEASFII